MMEIKNSAFNLNFVKTRYHSSSNYQISLEINLETYYQRSSKYLYSDSVIPLRYPKEIILNIERKNYINHNVHYDSYKLQTT